MLCSCESLRVHVIALVHVLVCGKQLQARSEAEQEVAWQEGVPQRVAVTRSIFGRGVCYTHQRVCICLRVIARRIAALARSVLLSFPSAAHGSHHRRSAPLTISAAAQELSRSTYAKS